MSGKSVVGRTGALRVYKYPERHGSGALTGPFARNFAVGPGSTTDIDVAPTAIPWAAVGVGTPGINVRITPIATGRVLIEGVIVVKSTSGVQESVLVQPVVNGLPLAFPLFEQPTIEAGGQIAIPVLMEVNALTLGSALPVGVLANVQILLTASSPDVLQMVEESSSLNLQEVPDPTG